MGRNKHLVARNDICRAKDEVGLDFRSLFDVYKSLFAKLWWVFKIQNSLWTNYICNKYCKNVRPPLVEYKGGSLTWKHMLEAREMFDQDIWWESKYGHSSVCYDIGTQLSDLLYFLPVDII